MAYRPQPGEAQFLAFFNQRRPEIEAYKRQHGGDLEGAFQRVTGTPWPEGRSVKIHGGVPEMTKDRTVKSVLGKYVAPIGVGALTALTFGGAAPALAGLFGGGGAAAGGAAAGGAAAGGAAAGGTAATAGGLTAAGLVKTALPLGLSALGRLGQGRAEGRAAEAEQQQAQDRLRMQAAILQREAPGARMSDAVYGDTLANVQDYQLTGRGRNLSSTGGLRPSLMSQGTRDLGKSASRQALLSQLGSTGEGQAPRGVDPYGSVEPSALPQPGGLDKFLMGAGAVAPFLPLLAQRRQPALPTYEDPDFDWGNS